MSYPLCKNEPSIPPWRPCFQILIDKTKQTDELFFLLSNLCHFALCGKILTILDSSSEDRTIEAAFLADCFYYREPMADPGRRIEEWKTQWRKLIDTIQETCEASPTFQTDSPLDKVRFLNQLFFKDLGYHAEEGEPAMVHSLLHQKKGSYLAICLLYRSLCKRILDVPDKYNLYFRCNNKWASQINIGGEIHCINMTPGEMGSRKPGRLGKAITATTGKTTPVPPRRRPSLTQ